MSTTPPLPLDNSIDTNLKEEEEKEKEDKVVNKLSSDITLSKNKKTSLKSKKSKEYELIMNSINEKVDDFIHGKLYTLSTQNLIFEKLIQKKMMI